jgi:hypothetical protein
MGVLTFGDEYAKMRSTHLGFIIPVLFLLICQPAGLDYVYCCGYGLIWRHYYLAEGRPPLISSNGERSDP